MRELKVLAAVSIATGWIVSGCVDAGDEQDGVAQTSQAFTVWADEPNNWWTSATPLKLADLGKGHVAARSDLYDWWVLTARENDRIFAYVDNDPGVDTELRYPYGISLLAHDEDSGTGTDPMLAGVVVPPWPIPILGSDDVIYLQVVHLAGAGDYDLHAFVANEDDLQYEAEGNDSLALANVITHSVVRGDSQAQGDVDYIRFQASGPIALIVDDDPLGNGAAFHRSLLVRPQQPDSRVGWAGRARTHPFRHLRWSLLRASQRVVGV